MKLLTIIVPSFKRQQELMFLISTMTPSDTSEVTLLVGLDDCSYDLDYVPDFVSIHEFEKLGRFGVIKELSAKVVSKYVMISDDDDFFLPGQLDLLLSILASDDYLISPDDYNGLTFKSCRVDRAPDLNFDLLPEQIYLADRRFKYNSSADAKEVIFSEIFLECISKLKVFDGRFPSSFLWLELSDKPVLVFKQPIMTKFYKENGLSSGISKGTVKGYRNYLNFHKRLLRYQIKKPGSRLLVIFTLIRIVLSKWKFRE